MEKKIIRLVAAAALLLCLCSAGVSAALPHATVSISRDIVIEDFDNSLPAGIYNGFIMNFLVIGHPPDGSGTSFGNLKYSIQTTNLFWVGWNEYAVWNETSAIWNFPSEYTIPEHQGLGVDAATAIPISQMMNVSLNRWFNQTRFQSTGYQHVSGNVSYANTAEIISTDLTIDMPFPDDRVNPTIVPGSFLTDAPVLSTYSIDTGITVSLDPSALQQGKVYNFSVDYRVEPNGTAVRFRPMVGVGVKVFQNRSAGTPGYGVDIPSHVLPDNLTAASVSTDTLSDWQLVEEHWVVTRLNQRVEPPVVPLPGSAKSPTDPDNDGIYEDLNGNGRLDFADVVLYFNQMTWIAANEPIAAFDLNGNGRIDFADIVALFNEI